MVLHLHAPKTGGRDADNRERLIVHKDDASHNSRIGTETVPPELVAQDCDGVAFGRSVIVLIEKASPRGTYAEHLEVVAADVLDLGELGTVHPGDAKALFLDPRTSDAPWNRSLRFAMSR